MPIYMDRHDVSEMVTAENVAQLHQEDLKIQDQFGCRGLTYWFDDKRKTAFCLIEAPNEQALKDMHDKAHGKIPHSIIEVDAAIVESFLGRIEDPEKAQNTTLNIINDPAFRIIMVLELNLLLEKQDEFIQSTAKNFSQEILIIIKSFEGSAVRQTNNQFLVSFKSVSNAVHASSNIQAAFEIIKAQINNASIQLKIGLTAGVPVTEKLLLFEETIKLAERMCEISKGEIIVTAEVEDLYKSENSNKFITGQNIHAVSLADEMFLNLLMDYMELNWTDAGLKVEDFCKPLGCSKSQLYRKMISVIGMSLNIFLKDYRLKKALELLNEKNKNVSEIAFETGFTSPSYFSKCFQKKYGHTPSKNLLAEA